MPNTFAYLVLFGWPLVVVVLFRLMPVPKAIATSIVAGYLLLPTKASFDLPLLPEYERAFAASLPAFLMALVMSRPEPLGKVPDYALPGWLPRHPVLWLCVIVLIASPFLTVLTNGDTLRFGVPDHPRYPERVLRGLRLYDGSAVVLGGIVALLPFFLARKYLAHPREQLMLLGVLFMAALAYSLPTLWEIRMSPQLNREIYGFFPNSWRQHLRGGGFRPIVFLEHGLRLGIFFVLSIIAAIGYIRARKEGGQRVLLVPAVLWLLATLVLCKTLGAVIIVVMLMPIVLFFGARMQILMAAVLAATVLTYPMTRAAGIFPVDTVMQTVTSIASERRVESLAYRFYNEDILLQKAGERPLFGWGGWGRARIYDDLGRDDSTPDGRWIIEFGERGWVGFLATFGLLTLPIMLLAVRRRSEDITLATAALALALVANLVDLIPNSALTPITWLMAGSLAGRLETKAATDEAPEADAAAPPDRHLPYRRALGSRQAHARPPVAAPNAPAASRYGRGRGEARS